MWFKFAFCSKGMKAIKTIKSPLFFDLVPLNNADNFLITR